MGKALLPVSLSLLEMMFQLPSGYKIIASHGEMGEHFMQFLVESPDIPGVEEGQPLPEMMPLAQALNHPFDPDFKRIIVNPKLRST